MFLVNIKALYFLYVVFICYERLNMKADVLHLQSCSATRPVLQQSNRNTTCHLFLHLTDAAFYWNVLRFIFLFRYYEKNLNYVGGFNQNQNMPPHHKEQRSGPSLKKLTLFLSKNEPSEHFTSCFCCF